MKDPYRSDVEATVRVRQELELLRRRQRAALQPLISLGSRRRGWMAAGIVGTIGFGLLCLDTLVSDAPAPRRILKAATWMMMPAYLLMTAFSKLSGRWLFNETSPAADARAALDKLRAEDPVAVARRWADRYGAESFAWPLVGATLLFPLLIHSWFFAVPEVNDPERAYALRDGFVDWVRMSLIVVGHTHLIVAALSARAAIRMAGGVEKRPVLAALAVLGWGTLSAAFPTVVFAPPLVAATGLLPLIVLFSMTASRAENEALLVSNVHNALVNLEEAHPPT